MENSAQVLKKAKAALQAGELIGLPTETVYGLAADATNGKAVAAIYQAKGRPSFNPLISHCSSLEMAEQYGAFNARAKVLAEAFWPGALTLVVPFKAESGISDLVRAGLDTIALRVPKGGAAELIEAFGKPVAAPSANPSGRVSPTTAQHVTEQLGDKVAIVIDAGPCPVGIESTIVSVADDESLLLRPGGISREDIEAVLGEKLGSAVSEGKIVAPGMMTSHYAPNGNVRLNAASCEDGESALNFGNSELEGVHTLSLSESGDLSEAAANLFTRLREFDALGATSICVAPIPNDGLGEAINDRLARAAAPRN